MTPYDLYDADTAERIREATAGEFSASIAQAARDGGAGIITVDDRRVYVVGDPPPSSEPQRMNNWRKSIIELLAIEEQAAADGKAEHRAQLEDDARAVAGVYLDTVAAALDIELPPLPPGPVGARVEWLGRPGLDRFALVEYERDLAIQVEANAARKWAVNALFGRCPECSAWLALRGLTIPGDFAAAVRLQESDHERPKHLTGPDAGGDYCDGTRQWDQEAPPPPLMIREAMIYTDSDRNSAGNAVAALERQGYSVDVRYGPATEHTSAKVLLIARHPGDPDPFEPF